MKHLEGFPRGLVVKTKKAVCLFGGPVPRACARLQEMGNHRPQSWASRKCAMHPACLRQPHTDDMIHSQCWCLCSHPRVLPGPGLIVAKSD